MSERTDEIGTRTSRTHTTDLASQSVDVGSRLTMGSTVLALIPHYQCEQWLPECLESLLEQTRPLDGIVVIHDGPEDPPVDIVERYPAVTLLASDENVGPYRLVQQVVDDTLYDAYMFQDADDWSLPERLEVLLAEAERTGAEMVGCQEFRLHCEEAEIAPFAFPFDVNAALQKRPTSFPLMYSNSVVARSLVQRLGGFATGLRFSGDAEFVRRAVLVARVVNTGCYGYVRRRRSGSLTTSPDTGLDSAARQAVYAQLHGRARSNAALVEQGHAPDLLPFSTAPPVRLQHLTGPRLLPEPGMTAARLEVNR